MTSEFKLPLISEGVEAADIAAVHVKEGDEVQAGQVLLEVETEKAVADIPSPQAGRIGKILVKPGQTVKIGEVLLTIDESGGKGGAAPKAAAEEKGAKGDGSKSASAKSPAAGSQSTREQAKTEQPQKAPSKSNKDEEETVEQEAEPAKAKSAPAPSQATAAKESKEDKEPAGDHSAAKPDAGRGLSAPRKSVDDNGHEAAPVPAGPATRRLARELGVDLHRVSGTGPGGRITTDDVQAFVRSLTTSRVLDVTATRGAASLPPFDKFGPIERQALHKLARVTAANLTVAWQTIPHVTQHDLADVTELEEARQSYMKSIGQNGPKVTMTAIMVKAVVGALKAFPHVNSSIDIAAGELVLKHYFHIGVAVDTEIGLLVPVIRDADRKTVLMIATELADLSRRARERKLDLSDMQGGSFTISNLGGIGGTGFTPIVNHPEAAILGMSRTQTQLKLVDGKLVERLMLPLSFSYDHRIVNGADAARFVVKLSGILSDVFQLLVEC